MNAINNRIAATIGESNEALRSVVRSVHEVRMDEVDHYQQTNAKALTLYTDHAEKMKQPVANMIGAVTHFFNQVKNTHVALPHPPSPPLFSSSIYTSIIITRRCNIAR